MTKQKFLFGCAILGFLVFIGCKKIRMPGQDNETKGVENLISADAERAFGRNEPPYCGNKVAEKGIDRWNAAANKWVATLTIANSNEKENMSKAIKQTVANLPASVLELVESFKLDVVVHDKPPEICKSTVSTLAPEKRKALEEKVKNTKFSEENHFACFDSPGGQSRPTIHIGGSIKLNDPNEKMTQQEAFVRTLLVRNIGIAYAKFFPSYIENKFIKAPNNYVAAVQNGQFTGKTQQTMMNAAQMVEDSKKWLAKNFMNTFSSYKASLRKDLFENDGLGKSAPIMKMKELVTANIIPASDFDDIVFAEIFDSYYCSANTRLFYEKNFKVSAKNFADNARIMIELVTPIVPKPARQAAGLRPQRR